MLCSRDFFKVLALGLFVSSCDVPNSISKRVWLDWDPPSSCRLRGAIIVEICPTFFLFSPHCFPWHAKHCYHIIHHVRLRVEEHPKQTIFGAELKGGASELPLVQGWRYGIGEENLRCYEQLRTKHIGRLVMVECLAEVDNKNLWDRELLLWCLRIARLHKILRHSLIYGAVIASLNRFPRRLAHSSVDVVFRPGFEILQLEKYV